MNGKSIADVQVRKKTGETIIAVRRDAEVFTNPTPEVSFKRDDIVLFTGERGTMKTAFRYFKEVF